jgi:hypothetical protein
MIFDTHKIYSEIENHDYIVEQCNQWVEHYNFLAGLRCNDSVVRQQYEQELSDYLIYDC